MSPLCPVNICVAAYVWTQPANKCVNLLLILSRRLLLLVGHMALVHLRLLNPQLGANRQSGFSPPASRALVRGVASLPAFLQTLPSACRFSAFVFSLNFPQGVMQKGASTAGLWWHSLLSAAPGSFSLHAHSHAGTTLLHKEEIFKPWSIQGPGMLEQKRKLHLLGCA